MDGTNGKATWFKLAAGLGVFFFALLISNLVLFVVDTTEYAVITQFGRPVRTILEPGLHWKLPEPIQLLRRYDNRLQVYEAGQVEFLTQDKKSIVVDYYASWKITDPLAFLKTVRDKIGAEARLSDVVSSVLGVGVGQFELSDLINTDPARMKLHEMLAAVTQRCNEQTSRYGIQIVNVEMRTLNFPEKNKLSVFRRMKAEREQMARKYRSEGSEEAAKIRAEARKEEKTILSEAYRKAETIKGEGDAEAIRIYAQAFQKDPEFYRFIRTLAAYDKIIDDKTTAILPADSDLLKYFARGRSSPAKNRGGSKRAMVPNRRPEGAEK
ncbi:MAG: protease modulator HflC [Kiritimatiellaeota bacterium]|nr:protease modulator HflC [Kiritimatiellota bacterium]